MCVVGKRGIILRILIFLLAGGAFCMPMYEENPPNKVVGECYLVSDEQ